MFSNFLRTISQLSAIQQVSCVKEEKEEEKEIEEEIIFSTPQWYEAELMTMHALRAIVVE